MVQKNEEKGGRIKYYEFDLNFLLGATSGLAEFIRVSGVHQGSASSSGLGAWYLTLTLMWCGLVNKMLFLE